VARVCWLLLAGCALDRSGIDPQEARDTGVPGRDAGGTDAALTDASDRDASSDAGGGDAGMPGRIVSVEAGEARTCAIDVDNRLYCWGQHDRGTLGLGDISDDVYVPTRVSGNYRSVTLFAEHACAVDTIGRAWCWGRGDTGATGVGSPIDLQMPAVVSGGPWNVLAVGSVFTCALDAAGTEWCWGNLGAMGTYFTPSLRPGTIGLVDVDGGEHYGCVVASSGSTFCAGEAHDNVLSTDGAFQPVEIAGAAARISAGWQHTCVRDRDGAARCWGSADEYATGHDGGHVARVDGPFTWADLALGRLFTCGITTEREVRCFGRNDLGQLGQGDTEDRFRFILRVDLPPATDVAAGETHACAVAEGHLYCWGKNDHGQLGLGDNVDRTSPTRVTFPG
jgi:alpha-tubulin suppressor-like RCC1 family protein